MKRSNDDAGAKGRHTSKNALDMREHFMCGGTKYLALCHLINLSLREMVNVRDFQMFKMLLCTVSCHAISPSWAFKMIAPGCLDPYSHCCRLHGEF